jgi:hypothetical protein
MRASVQRPGRFTPENKPGTHYIEGWVDPRQSGRVRKISPPPGLDPRTVQPVASRYTDWVIPAYSCFKILYYISNYYILWYTYTVQYFIQRYLIKPFIVFQHTFHTTMQCFSTAGPRPGTGPWHQLHRAARGSPGSRHFSFLSIFH